MESLWGWSTPPDRGGHLDLVLSCSCSCSCSCSICSGLGARPITSTSTSTIRKSTDDPTIGGRNRSSTSPRSSRGGPISPRRPTPTRATSPATSREPTGCSSASGPSTSGTSGRATPTSSRSPCAPTPSTAPPRPSSRANDCHPVHPPLSAPKIAEGSLADPAFPRGSLGTRNASK